MHEKVRIGCGSASPNDRIEPAIALAKSGEVDYLAFDRLAERTLALAYARRLDDPSGGYDEHVLEVINSLAFFLADGGRIVGSFGAANTNAAVPHVVDGLRRAGLEGLRVGVIEGDDIRQQVLDMDLYLPELQTTAGALSSRVISANAYVGSQPIVAALDEGASFILGGRIADPSLFVAPICHELGWSLDDWNRVGVATLAGHLLECGVYITGGNFADPPLRTAPNLHDLTLPIGVVSADGEIVITKLDSYGGVVNAMTVKSQLGYEVHDPGAYATPDVLADFTQVRVEETEKNKVRVVGARGNPAPETLKVLVGIDFGWKIVGEISFGGSGCIDRARIAEGIIRDQLNANPSDIDDTRFDLVGVNSLFGRQLQDVHPTETRLRVAARCGSKETAESIGKQVEYLYFGPAGGGGVTVTIERCIGVTSASIPRQLVNLRYEVLKI